MMSWFPWPESIKKRAVRYLLDHYLGTFLKDRISVAQLDIDIISGKASICDLYLDADEINDKIGDGLISVKSGKIGQIVINIPWTTMMNSSCSIELVDINFELEMIKDETVLFDKNKVKKHAFKLAESMCTSIAENMMKNDDIGRRCAETCLDSDDKSEDDEDDAFNFSIGFEGLDIFASTIESILSRTTLSVTNFTAKLNLFSETCSLTLQTNSIEFFDPQVLENPGIPKDTNGKAYVEHPILTKRLQFDEINIYYNSTLFIHISGKQNLKINLKREIVKDLEGTVFAKNTDATGQYANTIQENAIEVNVELGNACVLQIPSIFVGLLDFLTKVQETQERIASLSTSGCSTPRGKLESAINQMNTRPMIFDDFGQIEREIVRENTKARRNKHHANILSKSDPVELQNNMIESMLEQSTMEGTISESWLNDKPTVQEFRSRDSSESSDDINFLSSTSTQFFSLTESKFNGSKYGRSKNATITNSMMTSTSTLISEHVFKKQDSAQHCDKSADKSFGLELNLRQLTIILMFDNPSTLDSSVASFMEVFPDYSNNVQQFFEAHQIDGLGVTMNPIILRCNQDKTGNDLNTKVSVGKVQVDQHLYSDIHTSNVEAGNAGEKLTMTVIKLEPYNTVSMGFIFKVTLVPEKPLNLQIALGRISGDFDASFTDHLWMYLNALTELKTSKSTKFNEQSDSVESVPTTKDSTDSTLELTFPAINIRYFIATPDMRPTDHRDHRLRVIKDDFLIIKSCRGSIHYRMNQHVTSVSDDGAVKNQPLLELNLSGIEIIHNVGNVNYPTLISAKDEFFKLKLYMQCPNEIAIDPSQHFTKNAMDTLTSFLGTKSELKMQASMTVSTAVMETHKQQVGQRGTSPFSQRRDMYEGEKVLLRPGTNSELDEFKKHVKSSGLLVDIVAPGLELIIDSVEVLRILYNRLIFDIALWTPLAPKPNVDELIEEKFEPVMEEFSDSDEERDVYEKEQKENMKRSVKPTPPNENLPPGIGICLAVASLKLKIGCSTNNVVEIKSDQLNFLWGSYPQLPLALDSMSIRALNLGIEHSTSNQPILSECELSCSLKIDTDMARNIQKLLVTTEIKNANLQPDFKKPGYNVWEQLGLLSDAFIEDQVLGYVAPLVITNLHVHMLNSGFSLNTTAEDAPSHQYFMKDMCLKLWFSHLSLQTRIMLDQPEYKVTIISDGFKVKLDNAELLESNMDLDICVKNDVLLKQTTNEVPAEIEVSLTVDMLKVKLTIDAVLGLEQFSQRFVNVLNTTVLKDIYDRQLSETTANMMKEHQDALEQGGMPDIKMEKKVKFQDIGDESIVKKKGVHFDVSEVETRSSELAEKSSTSFDNLKIISGGARTESESPVMQKTEILRDPANLREAIYSDGDQDYCGNDYHESTSDDFCIISDKSVRDMRQMEGRVRSTNNEVVMTSLLSTPMKIKHDYFPRPLKIPDPLDTPADITSVSRPVFRLKVNRLNFELDIHTSEKQRFLNEGFLQNNYIKLKLNQMKGRIETFCQLESLLTNNTQSQRFTSPVTRIVFYVSSVQVFDRIQGSNINKLMYPMIVDEDFEHVHPLSNSMVKIVLREDLVPDEIEGEIISESAWRLSISMQPIRINISQTVIQFAMDLISEATRLSKSSSEEKPVDELEEKNGNSDAGPFFSEILFSPEVTICFDYDGAGFAALGRIATDSLVSGLVNLALGFAQIRCSEIKLNRIHHRGGISGWDKLMPFMVLTWYEDIKTMQLPKILSGFGPMHALSEVMDATIDLAKAPLVGYYEGLGPGGGGRVRGVVTGVKKGISRSTNKSTGAALEIVGGILGTVHRIAEFSHDFIAPTAVDENKTPLTVTQAELRHAIAKSTQPSDLREGATLAYRILTDGSREAVYIVKKDVSRSVKKHGVVIGGVGALWRHLPAVTFLKPIILSAEAAAQVIGGARNSLQPHKKVENEEKWRKPGPI